MLRTTLAALLTVGLCSTAGAQVQPACLQLVDAANRVVGPASTYNNGGPVLVSVTMVVNGIPILARAETGSLAAANTTVFFVNSDRTGQGYLGPLPAVPISPQAVVGPDWQVWWAPVIATVSVDGISGRYDRTGCHAHDVLFPMTLVPATRIAILADTFDAPFRLEAVPVPLLPRTRSRTPG